MLGFMVSGLTLHYLELLLLDDLNHSVDSQNGLYVALYTLVKCVICKMWLFLILM